LLKNQLKERKERERGNERERERKDREGGGRDISERESLKSGSRGCCIDQLRERTILKVRHQ